MAPSLGYKIVDVVNLVALSAVSVAVGKQKLAVWPAKKVRVSHRFFLVAGHRGHAHQTRSIERAGAAKIDQRLRVHIARHMDITVIVNRHLDAIVRIPTDSGRQNRQFKRRLAQGTLPNCHVALGIVKRHELLIAMREQGETNRMARPNRRDVNGFQQLNGRCFGHSGLGLGRRR